ncbi:MAG: flagellar biosynthesis protein FlhF [Nitrospinae bacterium]|nr:flagellar biosynthesis protein FlhF [Nitrospinota bacterium]MBF0635469.1 flagellar biosynthesis protein FlhF [Nitrospinota bacterium]
MMQVKRYEAVDMGEALRMVKSDLGPEAVILGARQVRKGEGAFGLFGRQVFEVTAASSGAPKPAKKKNYVEERPERQERQDRGQGEAQEARKILEGTVAALEPILDGVEAIRKNLDGISQGAEREKMPLSVAEDLRELKSLVYHLMDRSMSEKEMKMGKNLIALFRILKDRGVAGEYAQALIDEIMKSADGREPDIRTLIHLAAARMRDTMVFGGWITKSEDPSAGPKAVALVGPTGVGKTTTVAKLAARLAGEGLKVGLATIDTYRIAAVEQLKIYAKILNIPIDVVLTPHDLGRALHLRKGLDVILIDTAGRGQRDREQIGELAEFFSGHPSVDVKMTLSASSSERQMEEAIRNFSALSLSSIVFTKLDEAAQMGPVFNQSVKTGLPVAYFTTGQRVPEDMEEAGAKRLINGLFTT